MNKEQAITKFWESFGLPAYDDQTVPTGKNAPELPYITYNVATDSIDNQVALNASIWYRSTSWKGVTEKKDEVREALSHGGKVIPVDDGYLWLTKGTPFAQRMEETSDEMIRRIYLNITAEFLTAD